jgi:large subunit ribosomal protein L32|uniref:Large ribosomal subunit protein bL32c n=1 Tax=Kumanoa mahlacensis TaxID=1196387 RepID=A0A8K1YUE0_9FLOR|nr:ribosomal protein L32 [Kumanoa mahlacensis]
MAVPKKRTSKNKSRSRKANWKKKANSASQKAISIGKSILSGNNTSFIYTHDT